MSSPAYLPHIGLLWAEYTLTSEQGAYSITGQDSSLLTALLLTAEQGTYSLTGQDASFAYAGISTPAPLPSLGLLAGLGYTPGILTAEQGTYSITGQDAAFQRTYSLAADQGSYTLSGQVAALEASLARAGDPAPLPHLGLLLAPGSGGYTLTCDPGIYSIVGSDSLADFEVTAEQGTYSITGQDAGLLKSTIMAADFGTYSITGQDATFVVTGSITMLADFGTYDITGQSATTLRQYTLSAEHGFYAILGQDATFALGSNSHYVLTSDSGTYAITGQDATLVESQAVLDAQTGYYEITGFDTQERRRNAAGKSKKNRKKNERYIAKYKDQYYQFETADDLEEFVAKAKAEESSKPRKDRSEIKIALTPQFEKEIEQVVKVPARLSAMPTGVAMAQVRKMDFTLEKFLAKVNVKSDDEDEEMLMLLL